MLTHKIISRCLCASSISCSVTIHVVYICSLPGGTPEIIFGMFYSCVSVKIYPKSFIEDSHKPNQEL